MFDSSPVALPQIPRPLKRSASTASLPTPPRTHRKRGRGRSRGSCDSDSDSGVVLESDEEELGGGHKKRRTEALKPEDEDEFWLGSSARKTRSSTRNRGGSNAASSSRPLLYKRRQQADVTPVSPPPSHRKPPVVLVTPPHSTVKAQLQPSVSLVPNSDTVSPPTTPRAKITIRDSPNNPFLVSPSDVDTPPSSDCSPGVPSPRPTVPLKEKATMTYVFRGVRRTYPNPAYDHANDRPLSPPPNSRLPIDDPNYTPDMVTIPKLLFPSAPRKSKRNTSAKHHAQETRSAGQSRLRRFSLSGGLGGSSDEAASDEEEEDEIRPMKLTFGVGSPDPQKKTWDQEKREALAKAEEPVSD